MLVTLYELCAKTRSRTKARKSLFQKYVAVAYNETGSFQDWPRRLGRGLNINTGQALNHVGTKYRTGKDTRQIGRSVVGGGEDP
jgi:hypothetical protein